MAERRRGARRITINTELRESRARGIIQPTERLAARISGAEPRPGSMVDIESFYKFASKLREEIGVALNSGGLNKFSLPLPDKPHLAEAIVRRTISSPDSTSPGIPGIALVLTPNENGWSGFFAGKNFVRRVKSPATEEEIVKRNEILDNLTANK